MTIQEFNETWVANSKKVVTDIAYPWGSPLAGGVQGVSFLPFDEYSPKQLIECFTRPRSYLGASPEDEVPYTVTPLELKKTVLESPLITLSGETTYEQVIEILRNNIAYLLTARFMEEILKVPLVGNVDTREMFPVVEKDQSMRFFTRREDERPVPLYRISSNCKVEPNPEWLEAPYRDNVRVKQGWLKCYVPPIFGQAPEHSLFGQWLWVNGREEISPDVWVTRDDEGYLRGVLTNMLVLDKSKVFRIREKI